MGTFLNGRSGGLFVLGVLFLGTTGCGPDRKAADRVADRLEISSSIETAKREKEDRLRQIDTELAKVRDEESDARDENDGTLDARAQADESMIASLNIELAIQRSTDEDELASVRFRQTQESLVRQRELADLDRRIRDQERVLAEKKEALTLAIAPEGGDLRNQVESDYARTEAELEALRSSYVDLLATQSASPDRYYSEQTERLDALRSRQGDLAEMIQSARDELGAITREKHERTANRNARARRVRELEAERTAVMKTL
jgi:hypothetical protein